MTTGKNTDVELAKQLIAGTTKHFSTAGSLAFGNESFTPAELEALLGTLVDLRKAVDDAKTLARAKIVDEDTRAPPLRRKMAAYVAFVRAAFGNTPDALADFGLAPRKTRTPPTIEQMATAKERRAATRLARHTMGSHKRQQVKGTVVTIVPPPAGPSTQDK